MPSNQLNKNPKPQQGRQNGQATQNTSKHARDIQTPEKTPAPDEKGKGTDKNVHFSKDEESDQPTAEGSISQPVAEGSHSMDTDENRKNETDQERDQGTEEDSDEDEDEDEEEDEARPQPEEPVLTPWVRRIIQRETQNATEGFLDELFNWPFEGKLKGNPEPEGAEIVGFFERLNQYIRAENQSHPGTNIEDGIIPAGTYLPLVTSYSTSFSLALQNSDRAAAWETSNKTYGVLRDFNKRHCLPQAWNLSPEKALLRIGIPNPHPEMMLPYPDVIEVEPLDLESVPAIAPSDQSDQTILQRSMIDLDAIDTLAIQKRGLKSGEVLYWWTIGAGSQTFVRYGEAPYQIYRIRAGSHQVYDKTTTEQVLSIRRGNAKSIIHQNGIKKEVWKWGREHVKRIIGVGFKIPEDKEHGAKSKILMKPSYAKDSYPQTRLLVEWKDGNMSLEERSFGCRILQTKHEGIYSFLGVMEDAYWEHHGPIVCESDSESDITSEGESESGSESSYTDSESSSAAEKSKGRYKLRSGAQLTGHQHLSRAKRIHALERELQSLRISEGKSHNSSHSGRSQTPRNGRHRKRR